MRYAIYYALPRDHSLNLAAVSWLGRCAFTGNAVQQHPAAQLSAGEFAYHTAAARRYGFHATIVAPFTLVPNESEAELVNALGEYMARAQSVLIPRLVLKRHDGFFALMPDEQGADLADFASDVVRTFSKYCAPLSESETQRRCICTLTPSQRQNLLRWGYPFVFDDFRFHMTLTGRVADAEAPRVQAAIEEHFGSLIGSSVEVGSLALFQESERGMPFIINSFHSTAL